MGKGSKNPFCALDLRHTVHCAMRLPQAGKPPAQEDRTPEHGVRSGRNGAAKRRSGVRAPECGSAEWVRCPAGTEKPSAMLTERSEWASLILFTLFLCFFVRKCRKVPQHLKKRALAAFHKFKIASEFFFHKFRNFHKLF